MRTASVNSSCSGFANLRTGRKEVPARRHYGTRTPRSRLLPANWPCRVRHAVSHVMHSLSSKARCPIGTSPIWPPRPWDLGGWALDLLQIWGSYLANAPKEDLASWLHAHLGEQDARMGFSYSDVLADCDAWLLARSMQSNSSERSLSTAMRDMFAQSETNRIKRFYQSRFKGSADNLVIAFRKLVDGIDLGIFDNVSGSKKALLIASHADRLPSQAEAGILALSYAESLENPNR